MIAVSADTKRQLDEDLGLRPDVVAVVHNGMPNRTGNPELVLRELGAREGETLLLAVGSLMPRKGHIVLLQALLRLGRQAHSISHLCGGTEEPRHQRHHGARDEERDQQFGERKSAAGTSMEY